ncbi:MAG: peptide-methionine (S)-S-oxide reductase MsrA [Clostridia bacterium]|nr:peptide-methionine (S)-S-oxide reductase MsrA [Clostridia bacterium]
MKTVYFAGGCFWGMQKFFDTAPGVIKTEVGYANGKTENPTYEDVKHHGAGHAETVKVTFDEDAIGLSALVRRFLQVIDPFSVNKQGEDEGVQYRTGIYSEYEDVLSVLKDEISLFERAAGKKCAVEILPLYNYYTAEEYHQKYLEKNPAGYCHIRVKF